MPKTPARSIAAPKPPKIPAERMRLIESHVAMLAETARRTADTLGLQTDASDHARILEQEAEQ